MSTRRNVFRHLLAPLFRITIRSGAVPCSMALCLSVIVIAVLIMAEGIRAAAPVDGACEQRVTASKLAVVVGSSPRRSLPVADPQAAVAEIRSMVESAMLEQGFQLIDPALMESLVGDRQKRLVLAGNAVSAVNVAEKLGADLVLSVSVKAQLRKITVVQTRLKSVSAHFTFRLIDRRSARVLSSIPLQGTSASLDPETGVVQILERHMGSVADRLTKAYCRWIGRQKDKATVSSKTESVSEPSQGSLAAEGTGSQPSPRVDPGRGGANVLHPDPSSLQDL